MYEDFFDLWADGLFYLLCDELVSFYTFFTIIFAECIYLKVSYTNEVLPLIIILLGYIINIVISSWFMAEYEFTNKQKKYSIIYILAFIVLFVIGCFVNIKLCVITTAIAFVYTGLAIFLRMSQTKNIIWLLITQFMILGVPFIALVASIWSISSLPLFAKIIISILYVFLMPCFAYLEDVLAAESIFELFEHTFKK